MLCLCGCGGNTSLITENDASQGLVKGEYRRFISGHNRKAKGPIYWVNTETECWEWNRARSSAGYGLMKRADGVLTYAHRIFYETHVAPIPAGLVIDHLCRNRCCVNPKHLEPVPTHINAHRGIKTMLTEEDVVAIRVAADSGERTESISARYGISVGHVAGICVGKRWKSAGGPVSKRMKTRGRRLAKIGASEVVEIRAMRASGRKNVDIARHFGISPAYASQIATGALEKRLCP